MRSIWANVRLACGCWALFGGIMLLGLPAETVGGEGWVAVRWLGVLVGGAGLAITLRETAFMIAVFMRADRP